MRFDASRWLPGVVMYRDPRTASRRARKPFRSNASLAIESLEARLLLSAVNVTSYHNDPASTGQNLNESVLTPVNVNSTTFGKLHTTAVDGQVYAQPLYMAGVNVTAGAQIGIHNVTYVATEHDTLYAIDADSGAILWQDTFLVPAPGLTGSVTVTTVSSVAPPTSDLMFVRTVTRAFTRS